jgi:hypothetical protein
VISGQFKETIGAMKELMQKMCKDLDKTLQGNRTAAQRVRTSSVTFAKMAKTFRKESIVLKGKLKKMKKALRKS